MAKAPTPRFIINLPQRNPSASKQLAANISVVRDVVVVPMTPQHADWWHSEVQLKWIDANYCKAVQTATVTCSEDASEINSLASKDSRLKVRADVGWSWPSQLQRARWLYLLTKGRQIPYCWTMLSFDSYQENANLHPIGMLIVVPVFKSTINSLTKQRTFTWYLADAPSDLFQAWGIEPLHNIATGLLDTALQTANCLDLDGEMLLHASPSGGARLLRFYLETCGMACVSNSLGRISVTRVNDGRYFFFEPTKAKQFSGLFDPHR